MKDGEWEHHATEFLNKLTQLDQPSMTALKAVLYVGTSKPMFLASAKLCYFRGLTSIRKRLNDEAVCF